MESTNCWEVEMLKIAGHLECKRWAVRFSTAGADCSVFFNQLPPAQRVV
jgi:hypothetical protein